MKNRKRQVTGTSAAKKNAANRLARAPGPMVLVNAERLAPNNSYGVPDFVRRGHYVDVPFRCADCNSQEVWTGAQQKWWYEVAHGFAYSTATRCRSCRRKRRERRVEARRVHVAGTTRKHLTQVKKETKTS